MLANILRFVLLLVMALLVGTMFGIWVGANPAQLSPPAYVEQQQNMIRSFNTLLPVMGAVCILLVIALAVLSRGEGRKRALFFAAAALLVAAGLVTRFANQPINAIVVTWSAQSPPEDWTRLRDEWWRWHVVRTIAGMGALATTLLGVLGPRPSPPGGAQ